MTREELERWLKENKWKLVVSHPDRSVLKKKGVTLQIQGEYIYIVFDPISICYRLADIMPDQWYDLQLGANGSIRGE